MRRNLLIIKQRCVELNFVLNTNQLFGLFVIRLNFVYLKFAL
jgi:hypothetical protein